MNAARIPRRVVVTGGANGIGAATVRRLVAAGAIVASLDRDGDALGELATELGPTFVPVVGDVRDAAALEATVTAADGPIDALVINAAQADIGSVVAGPGRDAEEVVDVGLIGAWRTLRTVVPALRRPDGRVVIVTSTAVAVRPQLYGPYAASKAGLEALADALRLEVRSDGVSVGLLTLHAVDTPTFQRVIADPRLAPLVDALPAAAFRTMSTTDASGAVVRAIGSRRRRLFAPWWAAVPLLSPVLAQAVFDTVGALIGATRIPDGADEPSRLRSSADTDTGEAP